MKHFLVLALFLLPFTNAEEVRPNVLLITVDDMSAIPSAVLEASSRTLPPAPTNSRGESLRFQHAHVCVANCYLVETSCSPGSTRTTTVSKDSTPSKTNTPFSATS